MVNGTRARELTCGECQNHMGEFTEAKLADLHNTEALTLVEHHLSICPECAEECEALLAILRSGA